MEFRLLAAAALAVAALWAVLALTNRHDAATRRAHFDVALGAIVIGVVVGRIVAMVLAGTNPLTRPGDLLIVRGGVDTASAAIAALAGVALLARRTTVATLAALAPAALAGLAAWHGSCLVRSACLGTPSGLPWAYAEPGGAVTRHPVELYAAVLLGIAAVLVAAARTGEWHPLVVAGLAASLAAVARLVTEPLRPTIGGSRATFYLAAIVVGAGVAAVARWGPAARRSPPPVHS